ncbi:MAG TPA: DUF4389 domain-containing protein, partial [Actinomycetes bacterium]|nr:DUF4389 domain-containing protein [Actinomycetes bacterium]
GKTVTTTSGGIVAGLFLATLLMILFRQRYPRWWFDFARELTRFATRIGAYFVLLTDEYPSTVDEQKVHLDIDYPTVERDLNRWLPLVKWFLAIPHYIVLFILSVGAFFVVIFAWFAVLFTGHYPRGLFDFVVGVGRWALRVNAYAFLLVTDQYPPFSLNCGLSVSGPCIVMAPWGRFAAASRTAGTVVTTPSRAPGAAVHRAVGGSSTSG